LRPVQGPWRPGLHRRLLRLGLRHGAPAGTGCLGAQRGDAADYRASNVFTTDRRTTEKSKSAYLQWSNTWDLAMPVNLAVGVRYEKTDVTSAALVPSATGISWGSANELAILEGPAEFTRLTGAYHYWLPSLDFSVDLNESMKLRASYGKTIGRPGWSDIQGGQTLDTLVRVDG
ncbi:TonB-dependent receptor, partial [Xanthomonas sp. Kuri4-1]